MVFKFDDRLRFFGSNQEQTCPLHYVRSATHGSAQRGIFALIYPDSGQKYAAPRKCQPLLFAIWMRTCGQVPLLERRILQTKAIRDGLVMQFPPTHVDPLSQGGVGPDGL